MKFTPERIAVLTTSNGDDLIMRGQKLKAVREFAAEQNRRAEADEPSGPAGERAYPIVSATWWDNENNYIRGLPAETEPIKLSK